MLRKRRRLWSHFRASNSSSDYKRYRVMRNGTTRYMRQQRKAYEQDLLLESKRCPQKVYRYINHRMRKRDELQVLIDGDREISGDRERAEHLADYFGACYSVPIQMAFPHIDRRPPALTGVVCHQHLVETLLRSLDDRITPVKMNTIRESSRVLPRSSRHS